jgi:uroporphyrinogen decarboxylase
MKANSTMAATLADHPFLRACRREPAAYTPIWLMRQAGRYLPEYRRVRDRFSFLELCQDSACAAQVTVDTVRRLGVDAAIVFADILLPLVPMGVGLTYEKGDGPRIARTVRTQTDLEELHPVSVHESLGFVADTVRFVRQALEQEVPVIGFAGAPFTVASYAVEGGGSRNYVATKSLMYNDPRTWHRFMDVIADITTQYLNMQIDAGAHAVQLFDSWVGALSPHDYRTYVQPHSRRVIAGLRQGTPVIHFGTMTASLLPDLRDAGGHVIGLDWRVELDDAWARLGGNVGVQGNLDPVLLFSDRKTIREAAAEILRRADNRPGHIFNLGHGILPETPVDNVLALVEAVHELSRR